MEEKRLPSMLVHSYGFATFAFNVMMALATYYYSYFLTDVAFLLPLHVGTIVFITHIVDAISIPVSGSIIQKTQMRWGQFRSWLLFMPIFTFVFFTLTFTNLTLSYDIKIIYLSMAYMISHVCLNFAFNGHLGLISVLSVHVHDRARLSARNMQNIFAAYVIFSIAVIPMLNYLKADNETTGFFYTVLILSSFQIFGYWNLFVRTKAYDKYDPNKKQKPSFNLTWIEMIKQVIGNKQLMIIMVSDSVRDIGIFALVSVAVYYFKYIAGDQGWMWYYAFFVAAANLLSTIIAPPIIKRVGRKEICVYTCLFGVFGYIVLRFFGASSPINYIAIICVTGFGINISSPIRQAMYMDTAEYGYYKTGKNASAFIMSMYTLPVKIGIAIALSIIPYFLHYIGYIADMEATPEFVKNLMNLIAFVPAICYLIAGIIMMFYDLTDKNVAKYMEANKIARAKAQTANTS